MLLDRCLRQLQKEAKMSFKKSDLSDEYIISQTYTQFPVQFEIDSIRLFVGWEKLLDYDFEYLKNLTEAVEDKNGFNGRYVNFRVIKRDNGITISGSISNFYTGRTGILDFVDLPKAIEKLGKALKLDLHSARLFRLDFNWNVRTDYPPEAYNQSLFIDLPRYLRVGEGEGVRFSTKNKSFSIYNKSSEIYAKSGLIVTNWLRLEFKIFRDVKKEMGFKTIKDLYLKKNYLKTLTKFTDNYNQIRKKQILCDEPNLWKNWKMFENHLLFLGTESYGGLEKILEEIDVRSKMNFFANPNQKSRFKAKLKRLIDLNVNLEVHPLIKELDQKLDRDFKNLRKQLF